LNIRKGARRRLFYSCTRLGGLVQRHHSFGAEIAHRPI